MDLAFLYDAFQEEAYGLDLRAGNLRLMLVTDKYKPDRKKHRNRSHVSHEVEGKGYRQAGLLLPNQRVVKGVLKADPVEWERTTLSAAGAVIFYWTDRGPEFDCLIGFQQFMKDGQATVRTSFEAPFIVGWENDEVLALESVS
jgi:hypothetical protein